VHGCLGAIVGLGQMHGRPEGMDGGGWVECNMDGGLECEGSSKEFLGEEIGVMTEMSGSDVAVRWECLCFPRLLNTAGHLGKDMPHRYRSVNCKIARATTSAETHVRRDASRVRISGRHVGCNTARLWGPWSSKRLLPYSIPTLCYFKLTVNA
jgi:hypothetical protein